MKQEYVKESSYTMSQDDKNIYTCGHCKRKFRTYGAWDRHLTIKRGCIKLTPWPELGK